MLNILKELGGWPVLEKDAWDPSTFSWINSVYSFRKHGYSVDYFIDFSVTTDVKNSTYRVLDVSFNTKLKLATFVCYNGIFYLNF